MNRLILHAVCLVFVVGCSKPQSPAVSAPIFEAGLRVTSTSGATSGFSLGISGRQTHPGFILSDQYVGSTNGMDQYRVTIEPEKPVDGDTIVRLVTYKGERQEIYRSDKLVVEIHPSTDNASTGLATVVYSRDRTFEIRGTDVKGVALADLKTALAKHQQAHPGTAYELLAEVKNGPEAEKELMAVFKAAGVKLLHYWAPVSTPDPKAKPGKYGVGHVDLLK